MLGQCTVEMFRYIEGFKYVPGGNIYYSWIMLKLWHKCPPHLTRTLTLMSQGRPTQEAWCQNPHNCRTHWVQHLTHHLHKQYMLIGTCWFWWTTSWRMWWCIRCLGRAIFRYINDSAAVHVDKEHPGDCPTVLDAWAKQCWGVQLYKWFAVASWLLCDSA